MIMVNGALSARCKLAVKVTLDASAQVLFSEGHPHHMLVTSQMSSLPKLGEVPQMTAAVAPIGRLQIATGLAQ